MDRRERQIREQYVPVVSAVETEEGIEYLAEFKEFLFCGGSGKTKEEAIEDAYKNLAIYLEELSGEVDAAAGETVIMRLDNAALSPKTHLRQGNCLYAVKKNARCQLNMQRTKIKKGDTHRLYFFEDEFWIYTTSYLNGSLTLNELSENIQECVYPVDVTIERVGLFNVEVSGMWEFHTERRKWSKKRLRRYLRNNTTAERAVAYILMWAIEEQAKKGIV